MVVCRVVNGGVVVVVVVVVAWWDGGCVVQSGEWRAAVRVVVDG